MIVRRRILGFLVWAAACWFGTSFPTPLHAADGTWITDGSSTWSNTANWQGGIVADGSGFTANFNTNITTTRTVTLDSNRTLGNLVFGDNGTNGSPWIVNGSTGTTTLTLATAGPAPVITASTNVTIGAILAGNQGFTMAGPRLLTLTADNVYTGGTTISGGTLQIGNGGTTGSVVGDIVNNGDLAFNRSDVYTYSGSISGTGTVTSLTSHTVVFTGANTYSGLTIIQNLATLQLGNGGTTGSIVGNVVFGGSSGTLAFNRSDAQIFSGLISGIGSVLQQGTGTTVLTGANSYSGMTTVSSGTLQIGNGGTTGSVQTNIVDNSVVIFNRSGVYSFNGLISGTGNVSQSGAGTTVLTGANTYSGQTTVAAGTLQIGNGGTSGSVGSGNVTLTGALAVNRSDTITLSNTILGSGSLLQVGTGTTVLTGANSYSGGTTINGGTLQIAGASNGLGTGNVVDNGLLALNSSAAVTIANLISGTGALLQLGTGTTVLSGANTYSGATTLSVFSTLQLGNNAAVQNSTVNVTFGSTLNFGSSVTAPTIGGLAGNGGITLMNAISQSVALKVGGNGESTTYSGVLSGAGSLTKLGTGVLTLAGSNTYTGGTTISAGTLQLTGFGGLAGKILDNGILELSTSNGLTLTNDISGTGSVLQDGSGKTTFATGSLTYSGATTVAAGTLAGNLSPNSNLALAGGVYENSGTITRALGTGAGQIQWTGSGGFSSATSVTVNLGGTGQQVVWGQGSFVPNGGVLLFSYASASDTAPAPLVKFVNPIDLGGATRTVQVTDTDGAVAVSSDYVEMSGVLSNGGLLKTGVGTLYLSAANTYSGGTTIADGKLSATDGVGLPASGNLTFSGGTLQTSGSFTRSLGSGAGRVQWIGSGGFTSSSGSLVVNLGGTGAQVIWGQSGFVPSGSALISTTDVTFVNPINLNGATRTLAGIYTGTISNGGVTNASQVLILAGTNTFAGGLTIDGGAVQAVDGVSLPTAANLVITNSGVLNTGGVFTRSLGTGAANVQWLGSGGFGALGADLTVNLGGAAQPVVWGQSGFVTLTDALYFATSDTASKTTFVNPINLNGATRTIAVDSPLTNVVIAGALSNGGLNVQRGDVYLSGTNTYSGATTISFGLLRAIDGVGLPSASNLVLDSASVFESSGTFTRSIGPGAGQFQYAGLGGGFAALGGDLTVNIGGDAHQLVWGQGGFRPFFGDLRFGDPYNSRTDSKTIFMNPIDLNGGSRDIFVYDNSASPNDTVELAGVISNGSFSKWDAGTLILSAANTFAGTTTILDGTVQVANPAALQNSTVFVGSRNGLTFSAGVTTATIGGLSAFFSSFFGEFPLADLAGSPVVLSVGANNISTTYTSIMSGPGSLVKVGTSTLILSGANTYTGGTTVAAGTLQIGNGGTSGSIVGNVAVTTSGTLAFNHSSLYSFNGILSGTGNLTNIGTGTLALTQANTFSGRTLISAGPIRVANNAALQNSTVVLGVSGGVTFSAGIVSPTFGGLAGTGNLALADEAGSAVVLTVGNNNLSTTYGGTLSGAGGLVKGGGGTWTLTGASTYSGATTVSAGTLQLGNGGTTGSVGSGNFTLTGALAVNHSNTLTLNNTILGSGRFLQLGTGTTILTASNAYSGGTTVAAGVLRAANNNALGTGGVILFTGGQLDVSSGINIANPITFSGGTLTGVGTLVTNVSTGGTANQTLATVLGGTGSFTQAGTGTTVVSGSNSYSGGTTVLSGMIRAANNNAFGLGTVVIQNGGRVDVSSGITISNPISFSGGGVLSGKGTIVGSVTVSNGGILAPGNSPGTLHFTGPVGFGPNGGYTWEINDVAAGAGLDPGWDLIDIAGQLMVTSTSGAPYHIDVTSLTLGNAPGNVYNFNPSLDYDWVIAIASGGITGFSSSAFQVDTSGFSNPFGGVFSTQQSGNSLYVHYAHPAAVPEPGSCTLALLAAAGWYARRRRRSSV